MNIIFIAIFVIINLERSSGSSYFNYAPESVISQDFSGHGNSYNAFGESFSTFGDNAITIYGQHDVEEHYSEYNDSELFITYDQFGLPIVTLTNHEEKQYFLSAFYKVNTPTGEQCVKFYMVWATTTTQTTNLSTGVTVTASDSLYYDMEEKGKDLKKEPVTFVICSTNDNVAYGQMDPNKRLFTDLKDIIPNYDPYNDKHCIFRDM